MTPTHDFADLMLNAHPWYRIETPLDYVRAGIWCASNLVTAVSYFLIPQELARWRREMPFAAGSLIGQMFMGLIFFSGLSHLAMLAIVQTGPWWATLFVFLPMAVVSSGTLIVIRRDRRLILAVLVSVAQGIRGGSG